MSKWYPEKDSQELKALRVLENGIKRLAEEFQGKSAFNFAHELELVAYLLVRVRESGDTSRDVGGVTVHLAHMEWPCMKGRSIDFVLWKPGTESIARSLWGKSRAKLARTLPLLAAIQVKRGPGRLSSWSNTLKDIKDLEALYTLPYLEKPVLYFLEWVDHGLQEHENDRMKYREIQAKLTKWCNESSNRRAFVISRDRVQIVSKNGTDLELKLMDTLDGWHKLLKR